MFIEANRVFKVFDYDKNMVYIDFQGVLNSNDSDDSMYMWSEDKIIDSAYAFCTCVLIQTEC